MAADSARKVAILVAGTHRSGTSALTRILSVLGGELPKTLLEASQANEKGFWESVPINRLNDDLLALSGQRWFDVRRPAASVDPGSLEMLRQRALTILEEEFGDAQTILLKDPRVCRLLPFWRETLGEFGARPVAVLPIRNPLEAAESIHRRNSVDPAVGYLIWLRDVLDSELGSRGLPRVFVRYESLIEDWRTVVARISTGLGIAWAHDAAAAASEIDAFLRPSLRHHVRSEEDLSDAQGLPGWLVETFLIVDRWARTGEALEDLAALDRVREDFDAALPQFDGVLEAAKSNRVVIRESAHRLRQISDDLSRAHARTQEDSAKIEALKARLADSVRRIADASVDAARLLALGEQLDRLAAKSAEQAAVAQTREATLKVLHDQLATGVTLAAEADARIRSLNVQIAATKKELAEEKRELERSVQELTKSRRNLAKARRDHAHLQEELEQTRQTLSRARQQHVQAELDRVAAEKSQSATVRRLEARYAAALGGESQRASAERSQLVDALSAASDELNRRELLLDGLRRDLAAKSWKGRIGRLLGRRPTVAREERIATSSIMQPQWYLARYPDVAFSGMDPVRHYLEVGAAEGRDPGPNFSTRAYLEFNPDVAAAGINPLLHYLDHGLSEKRRTFPVFGSARPSSTNDKIELPGATSGSATAGTDHPRPAEAEAEAAEGRPTSTESTTPTGDSERRRLRPKSEPNESDLVTLLKGSSFFDAQWYRARYPEVAASDLAPVVHFLRHGGSADLDPGPAFSSSWYNEKNPHVKRAGVNPLVHYLRHGRANGRPIAPSASAVESVVEAAPDASAAVEVERALPPAPEPLVFAKAEIPEETWLRHSEFDRIDESVALRVHGEVICALPADKPAAASIAGSAIACFIRLVGLDLAAVRDAFATLSVMEFSPQTESGDAALPIFPAVGEGEASLADIWFANQRDLRLRIARDGSGASFAVRFHQYDVLDDRLTCVGEAIVPASAPVTFVDAELVNPYMPVLVTATSLSGSLLASALLPFPSLCRGGAHYAELCAAAANPSGELPLATLSSRYLAGTLSSATPAIARLTVDLAGATGAERIFSDDVSEWLWMMGVRASAAPATCTASRTIDHLRDKLGADPSPRYADRIAAREASDETTLLIPACALPTVEVLSARAGEIAGTAGAYVAGSVLLSSADTAEPRWLISMPALGAALTATQPIGSPILPQLKVPGGLVESAGVTVEHVVPVAVRYEPAAAPTEATLLAPVAPDAPGPILRRPSKQPLPGASSLSVLIAWEGGSLSTLESLLASLRLQTWNGPLEVIAVVTDPDDGESAADELLGRHNVGAYKLLNGVGLERAGALDLAAAHANGSLLLTAASTILLQDRRCLEVLETLAITENVGSAGCLLIQPDMTKKKPALTVGSFADLTDLVPASRPGLPVGAEIAAALGLATVPVMANRLDLAMLQTVRWQAHGGFASRAAVEDEGCYWDRALEAGLIHLCTSAVSATLSGPGGTGSPLAHAAPSTGPISRRPSGPIRAAEFRRLRG